MSEKFLHRKEATFSEKVWEKIDETVVVAAKSRLSGRKLIRTQSPYGLGVKALPSGDKTVDEKTAGGTRMTVSCITPLAMIQSEFTLPIRDIAAFEQSGLPLDLCNAAKAAISCAQQEDNLIFNGSRTIGLKGLLNIEGTQSAKLKQWNNVGTAADDILRAVRLLDNASFHGPYALGLSVELYNLLFRRYPQGSATEFEHIRQFVTDGIIKVPIMPSGGILLCTCGFCADIILGQDLMTGFVGPSGSEYQFIVSESVALWLTQPEAICILKK
jgi:uncharacterized linocin/CFP29 family protein